MTSEYYEAQRWYVEGYKDDIEALANAVGQVATTEGYSSSAVYYPYAEVGDRLGYVDGSNPPPPAGLRRPLSDVERQIMASAYQANLAASKQETLESFGRIHEHLVGYWAWAISNTPNRSLVASDSQAVARRELDYAVARQQSLRWPSHDLGKLTARRTLVGASTAFAEASAYSVAHPGNGVLLHEFTVVAVEDGPVLATHNLTAPYDALRRAAQRLLGDATRHLVEPILDGTLQDQDTAEGRIAALTTSPDDGSYLAGSMRNMARLLRERHSAALAEQQQLAGEGAVPDIERLRLLTDQLVAVSQSIPPRSDP
jgi:hypothetical protein